MSDKEYICTSITTNNICQSWKENPSGGYKLTNGEMASFILAIASLQATVAVFKIIRRSFFK